MKVRYIFIAMLLSTSAMAQQMPSEYTVKVSPTELDTIGKGLGTQPFNEAAPLINKLREQVVAQQPKVDNPSGSPIAKPENGK